MCYWQFSPQSQDQRTAIALTAGGHDIDHIVYAALSCHHRKRGTEQHCGPQHFLNGYVNRG